MEFDIHSDASDGASVDGESPEKLEDVVATSYAEDTEVASELFVEVRQQSDPRRLVLWADATSSGSSIEVTGDGTFTRTRQAGEQGTGTTSERNNVAQSEVRGVSLAQQHQLAELMGKAKALLSAQRRDAGCNVQDTEAGVSAVEEALKGADSSDSSEVENAIQELPSDENSADESSAGYAAAAFNIAAAEDALRYGELQLQSQTLRMDFSFQQRDDALDRLRARNTLRTALKGWKRVRRARDARVPVVGKPSKP